MKNALRMISVLIIVGLVSGGVLVCVYNYASPLIQRNEEEALQEAIFKVLPGITKYNELKKDGMTLYEGLDQKGNVSGYVFIAEGNGYQGPIRLIASLDKDLSRLTGLEVLESSETPGLGAEITQEFFKEQFRNLPVLLKIAFTKGAVSKPNEVQAITGATISTRAVVEILNLKIEEIRSVFGK
ncbi:MAG: RnfABCDGE type electron transport complex subunit G [Candidatus Omnitrophica bacterium]|nr:RnfABCDGE type electron transport complex subunit G [Candidatus Omnitrophota bacterium]